MALIATHIRFALDVAKHYPLKNLQAFIAGTVYPDSRWTSGIDRELTHDERFLDRDFPQTDYTYGWHVHCLCDELQKTEHEPLYQDLDLLNRLDRWIVLSVAKVIQDMNDLQQFDLLSMLPHLNYVETPNGENPELVKKFFRIIQNTYRDGKVPTPDDYGRLWRNVDLDKTTTSRLTAKLKESLLDTRLVRQIENAYDNMLAAYHDNHT